MTSVLRNRSEQAALLWKLIVQPWPASLIWFAGLTLIGGIAPYTQIWATTQLINSLAEHSGTIYQTDLQLWNALVLYLPLIAILIGAWIISIVVSMNTIQPYIATYHAEYIVEYWSRRVLEKAVRLQLEQFENPSYFDALQRARSALNVKKIAQQHSQFQRILARGGGCIGIILALSSVHWLLATVLVVSGIAVTYWRLNGSRAIVAIQLAHTPLQRQQEYWRNLLIQRNSAAEVRLFRLSNYCIQKWQSIAHQLQSEIDRTRIQSLRREFPITVAYVSVFSFSGVGLLIAAQYQLLSPGVFVAMLFAIQQFLELMQNFSRVDKIHQVIAELSYIPPFLALEGSEIITGIQTPHLGNDGIRFCNVSFAYLGTNNKVLEEVDVHIRPGERIAIVGENGAGKSTFARLLLGLYCPTDGKILVEGIDLRLISHTSSWREQIAAVFQDFMRYSSTVRDNIAYYSVN